MLLPNELHAFYSIAELKTDALGRDPSIKIRAYESGDQMAFIVALRKPDKRDVYSHGSLELVEPQGVVLGRVEIRGEDIRRALSREDLRTWGCGFQAGRGVPVYRPLTHVDSVQVFVGDRSA